MTRIIADHHHNHWCAHFADTPYINYGASDPAAAIRRLLTASPERELDEATIVADSARSTGERMEFTIQRHRTAEDACPECGGTGRYVGLLKIEPCRCMS